MQRCKSVIQSAVLPSTRDLPNVSTLQIRGLLAVERVQPYTSVKRKTVRHIYLILTLLLLIGEIYTNTEQCPPPTSKRLISV